MSKNREESTNYYLYIDGQAVPVSEQVYRVYQHYERKEEYFSYDLKTEKFRFWSACGGTGGLVRLVGGIITTSVIG